MKLFNKFCGGVLCLTTLAFASCNKEDDVVLDNDKIQFDSLHSLL